MDDVICGIRVQARMSANDAIGIATMLEKGYSEREVKAHFGIATHTWKVYMEWIGWAVEHAPR